jgi:hypothetical protein
MARIERYFKALTQMFRYETSENRLVTIFAFDDADIG